MSKIEKSTILVEKEAELKKLQAKKKKVLTQLKRNKTILRKLKEGIEELQRKSSINMPEIMMSLMSLKKEIIDLLTKINESDKIPAEEKEGLPELIADFKEASEMDGMDMDMDGKSFEEMIKEMRENMTDEFDRTKSYDFFEQFVPETPKAERKDIRKLYLKLASMFHPDKAKSPKEQEQFHSLMQLINDAYQRNDLATLLEYEIKYGNRKTINDQDLNNESAVVDFIDAEISRETNEIDLLKEQLSRTKEEIKNIKTSDIGYHYKDIKDAEKYGYGGLDEQFATMKEEVKGVEAIRDGLKEYLETGVMPEIIEEAFFSSPFDFDLFGDDDDFDEEEEVTPEEFFDALNELMNEIFEEEEPKKSNPKPKQKSRRKKN